jgi:uncharacterized protein YbjQ (UPF0145 family)
MAPEDLSAQDGEQQASLAQLEAGRIPFSAQRRLHELRDRGGAFTSDLSVSDFALCHQLGLKPLSQVMGTSVYQIGYQETLWGVEAAMSELRTLSQAWNEARDRALSRLREEAVSVGASAVVGVEVRSSMPDWAEVGGYGAIEYVITGTAVDRGASPAGRGARGTVVTELSVADYAKLLTAGIEPVGTVAWTAVFFVSNYFLRAERPLLTGFAYQNFELTEATQCFYSARERVTSELGRQAKALGASGIVGVRIRHTVNPGTLQTGPSMASGPGRQGLIASFSAIGTAVHDTGAASPQMPLVKLDLGGTGG